jgi:hypothetical protein
MTIGVRAARWVTVLLVAGVATACTSSSAPDRAGSNATKQSRSGSGSSSAAPSAPGATAPASAGGGSAAPATKRQIVAAYDDFFASTSTTTTSQAALQHGEVFTKTLEEQSKNSYSDSSGVKVAAVDVRGSVADVTFTITSNGTPLLSGVKGFAVKEGGRWKVAAATFCELLKLQGPAPAACDDASITALPK